MATRLQYREALEDKLLGLEDEGYGDFEYASTELNTFLELAVARLYPAVYRRVRDANRSPRSYGKNHFGYIDTGFAERVFLLEDATELTPIFGWQMRPGRIVGISQEHSGVNLYYHDAFELPANDDEDDEVAAIYKPLIVLGALIEALEARHDTGVRGDPGVTGDHKEVQLVDRLQSRYVSLREDLAMALPGVMV